MASIGEQLDSPSAHLVQLYDDDADLHAVAGSYLADAAARGDTTIVIATPAHRRLLAPATALALDAAETLRSFTVDGALDEERFDAVVGTAMREAATHDRPIAAFGEMVGLLWEAGDVTAALELEDFWGRLADTVPFSLFCAYPAGALADPRTQAAICGCHSAVVGERRFAPGSAGIEAARRFVSGRLASWGLGRGFIGDARLVVTELAGQARSEFALTVNRVGSGVRIVVAAAGSAPPTLRPGISTGMDWGYAAADRGTSVWVQLS